MFALAYDKVTTIGRPEAFLLKLRHGFGVNAHRPLTRRQHVLAGAGNVNLGRWRQAVASC